MKSFVQLPCFPAVAAVLILGSASPLAAQASRPPGHPGVARVLRHDLKAIPSGSPPTEAQIQVLSADLGALFRHVEHQPTVTLDYLAARLADATAQGQFGAEGLRTVARKLTHLLDGNSFVNEHKISVLESILAKAGAERKGLKQLVDALRALPNSFLYDSAGDTTSIGLKNLRAGTRGYLHSRGNVYLTSYRGPASLEDGSTNPAQLTRSLSVDVSQVPRGKYHLSVTTKTSGQSVDLGAFRVRVQFGTISAAAETDTAITTDDSSTDEANDDGSDDPTETPPPGTDDPAAQDSGGVTTTFVPVGVDPPIVAPPHSRGGFVSFGDAPYDRPLPAGLSLVDVVGITITDEQGVPRLTGSFLDPEARQTNRSLNLQFVAGAAAPTARGRVSLSASQGAFYQNENFLLTAAGLPANAALTLSVDGKPVGQVTTDPTGRLLVKAAESVYPKPSKGNVVNLLPDTVDLFSVGSFGVSDAQGNVLASAGF